MWWNTAKEQSTPEEIIKILQKNKIIINRQIRKLDNDNYLYRWGHRLFSLFSLIAGIADRINKLIRCILLQIPVVRIVIQKFTDWKNHLNFKESIEFLRTKLYSLKRTPHKEEDVILIQEIIEFLSKNGFDIKTSIPRSQKKFIKNSFFCVRSVI